MPKKLKEGYNTRASIAHDLREIADTIERKDDGQLCKMRVHLWFANPLECVGGTEYLEDLKKAKIDAEIDAATKAQ